MLDELVYGDAERLSPDAPVPVLQVERTERRPGGSANVCLDLVAIGGAVRAVGVVGDDAAGAFLRDDLAQSNIHIEGIITDAARPTTVKRSLIGLAQHRHAQKMFRLDMESRQPIGQPIAGQLLSAFDSALVGVDVVCIEDYGKGVCTPELCQAIIKNCNAAGVPVLVDPARREEYTRYRGASCVTPNRSEAQDAAPSVGQTASSDPAELASVMRAKLNLDAIVLTLDRDGAVLATADAEPIAVPTLAREVYDVTGAGDMVLAALAGAMANKTGWLDAVRFANAAAGLEVEIFGVEPLPLERIHHAVLLAMGKLRGKQRTVDELLVELAARRREGKRIVFTNGCFDIIHAGHIALLREAARFGDVLVIGVNSDDSVRRLKGPDRPVHHENDRLEVLCELESVAAVVLFDADTPIELIRAIKPDVLVKGADYHKSEVVGADEIETWGGRVELVPLLEGRSTSAAIDRLRAQ